jgi:hypothetical protein
MFDQDPQYPFPGPMLYEESGLGLGCVKSRRREKLMEQISLRVANGAISERGTPKAEARHRLRRRVRCRRRERCAAIKGNAKQNNASDGAPIEQSCGCRKRCERERPESIIEWLIRSRSSRRWRDDIRIAVRRRSRSRTVRWRSGFAKPSWLPGSSLKRGSSGASLAAGSRQQRSCLDGFVSVFPTPPGRLKAQPPSPIDPDAFRVVHHPPSCPTTRSSRCPDNGTAGTPARSQVARLPSYVGR